MPHAGGPLASAQTRAAIAIVTYFASSTTGLLIVLLHALPGWRRWRTELLLAVLPELLESEMALFVLFNFFLSALLLIALITSAAFLGRLSPSESQRLSHRIVKYCVFKTVFMGSVITPDPRDVTLWLAWFAMIGYLRVFLGAAKDRLELLLAAAPGTRTRCHVRAVCLLLLVLLHNVLAFGVVLHLLPGRAVGKVLLCAFDAAVIGIEGAKTLIRYGVHMYDRHRAMVAAQEEAAAIAAEMAAAAAAARGDADGADADADLPGTPTAHVAGRAAAAAAAAAGGGSGSGGGGWTRTGGFLYYMELAADVCVHLVTMAHYLHVWVLHGLSFHLIDVVLFLDMRAVLMSLVRRLRTHVSYCAATRRLDTSFRDVHPAALAAAQGGGGGVGGGGGGATLDCTICMDEIAHVAKQLPCGHVFHLGCLRAWLQQSGAESFTCPNCRQPILVPPAGGAGAASRASRWRALRLVDQAYVRLVMAVEPLVLSVLLRLALWLGPPRREPRRRQGRSGAPQSGEGFGESPGPAPAAARRHAAAGARARYDAAAAGPYGTAADAECRSDEEEETEEGEEGDAFDAGGLGAAAARVRRGYGGGSSSSSGGGEDRAADGDLGSDGGCSDGGGRTAAALLRQRRGAARNRARAQGLEGRGAGAWDEGRGGAGGEQDGAGRPEPSRGAAWAHAATARASRRAARAAAAAAGAAAEDDARAAAAAARPPRAPPPAAPELPSFSGDVLPAHAAAVARSISAGLRASWVAGIASVGAVAGRPEHEDAHPEVSSRPRTRRQRGERRSGAAARGRAGAAYGGADGRSDG